ncbi:MAG: GNAT family N-acetyltransferase [Anaerolineae bacterium]
MRTSHRSYDDVTGDLQRLCRFSIEHAEHLRAHSTWSLGRFVDWRYGLFGNRTSISRFWNANGQLWFDGFGDLAGAVISEEGDGEFAIFTAEGYRFLFEEMLQWVLANWGERGPCLSIEVTERQAAEIDLLERYGFRVAATFYSRRFDLTGDLPKRFPLEEGFAIVDMLTHPDYYAQRILREDGFSGKSALSEGELEQRLALSNYSHESPIYEPRCDLNVMAPDGTFVSGCEALLDVRNFAADIERICTHSGYRRRGFARSVIQECMFRLRDMGIRSAYICGYSPAAIALYGSLGHVEELACYEYELAR